MPYAIFRSEPSSRTKLKIQLYKLLHPCISVLNINAGFDTKMYTIIEPTKKMSYEREMNSQKTNKLNQFDKAFGNPKQQFP